MPRATRDIDFVVNLRAGDVDKVVDAFKDGYYCDRDTIKDAIKNKGIFNIIDYATGFKADFVILKDEPFQLHEFGRRKQADFFGTPVYIVSAEDLLLSKLIWIQQFQSSLQIEDIKSLSGLNELDWGYIRSWISTLHLNTFNLI